MARIHLRQFIAFSFNSSLALLVLLVLHFPAQAQTAVSAGIRGTVKAESNDAPIRSASVSVRNSALEVERVTQTDEDGQFSIAGLPPGIGYEVTVSAEGFLTKSNNRVALVSGETLALEVSLAIKSLSESVTIVDDAALVVSNAPEMSQVVDARRVAELPSNGRSLNRFALLDPHVRNTGGLGADGSTAARLSINANSYRHTFYKLDGNSNYDFVFANAPQQQVSLSSVQEFKVLTNQYSAEYGGSSAGIVSAVTRAGTDAFHGEGFFFLRPSGLQAAPPVSTLRVPNQLMQFGGALGGPLWTESATFFVNYEQSRQNRGAFVQSPAPLIYVGHFRDYLGLMRFDYRFNDAHTLNLRVNGNRNTNDNQNDRVSGFTQPSAAQRSFNQGTGAQLTDRIAWDTVINEFRLSYVNSIPSASAALSPQVSIVRPNYSTEGGSSYSWVRSETWQAADQLALQRGRHELKMGGDYSRQRVRDFSYTTFGEYRFATGAPRAGENPIDFTQRFGLGYVRYGQTLASVFVQDNWRVTSRLTANLGLRYDYQSITDDRNNFAPRLGFALDLAGDRKTIIRGGAGIFYDQYYMYITRRFLLEGTGALTKTYRLNFGAPGFPTFPNSLSAPPSGVSGTVDYVYLPGEKLLNPYSMQFSLGAQRRLFNDWTLTLDLIHSRTLKQMRVNDINAPAPFPRTVAGQVRSVAAADLTRPFGTNYNGVSVRRVAVVENTATSTYDALDLGLLKRFSKRFQMEAHYVYSSALNDAMFFGEADTGIPNEFRVDGRLDHGPSDFHQRHRFVAHGMVELPFASQLSFVATLGSGLPINPVTGVDNNGDGYRVDRPVNMARNSFRTPAQASFDTSFAKRFALSENVRLELRAEAFNLFNHSNFIKLNNIYGNGPTPDSNFLAPLAGISNSDPGRQFQFGARLIF